MPFNQLFQIGSYLFEFSDGVYWLHIKQKPVEGVDHFNEIRKAVPMIRDGRAKSKKDAESLVKALIEWAV